MAIPTEALLTRDVLNNSPTEAAASLADRQATLVLVNKATTPEDFKAAKDRLECWKAEFHHNVIGRVCRHCGTSL